MSDGFGGDKHLCVMKMEKEVDDLTKWGHVWD